MNAEPATESGRVAWRQSLGAGLLLGLALGCGWLARFTPLPLTRAALIAAAATLGVIAVALLLPASSGDAWGTGWQRRLDFHFAAAGIPFFALMALLAVAAFTSGNNLLYLVVAVLLAALLVSGFTSALNLSGMVLRFRHPDEIFAGEAAPVEFTLSNEKSIWPSFSLTVAAASRALSPGRGERVEMEPIYFPHLPSRGSVRRQSQLCFPRRGRYAAASFTLATRFPFALIHKRRRFQATGTEPALLVYPERSTARLDTPAFDRLGLHRERHQQGAGQELYRIRPHQPGDSARNVHWKASARARELRVREFSQEGAWRVCLRLSLPAGLAPERGEAALSLCAGLVSFLCQEDYWLAFRGENATYPHRAGGEPGPGLDLPLEPATGQRRAVLDYLAVADPTRSAGLPPAATSTAGDLVEIDVLDALSILET